ncbi:MAG: gamma-glutamyltransferase [Herminiimonas sp.]|nr:gamma-glutamyltransferase [Herminiimonas sp.]
MIRFRQWGAAACLLLAGCAIVRTDDGAATLPVAPEAASGYTEKTAVAARTFMVAAANPHATHAGYTILKAGGSAVDAAIAVQMVLTLVEPESSGIGGGAFMLHFDGARVSAFDGRETAPAAVDGALFKDASGKPMPFFDAVVGGRSVGVPGVLRMLELAHRDYGKLPWADLFGPAIALAENGFEVSPRLSASVAADPFLARDPEAAAYFLDTSGAAWPAGHLLKNPALAKVLRVIAVQGADAFYSGELAAAIVEKVRRHPVNPGQLSLADLAGYRAVRREPVCSDYKAWTVCGMSPPSSGGIAIAQMLGILANRNLRAAAPVDGQLEVEGIHLIAEAGRLAYADRARYVADTDFVPLPGGSPNALLDRNYLAARGALIGKRSMGTAAPGAPLGIKLAQGIDQSPELHSTSHLSIVDASGHAVAMTTSVENSFGSRLMVRGFMLNNQLTDFSFEAADADGPIANRVQPGKRPRSAMAPTLVLDRSSHELVMAIGSPGGPAIINYVVKVLIGVMDWGLNIQQAISLPNFGSRNGPTELEQGRVSPGIVSQLGARGHAIRLGDQTSGLQGIMRVTIHGEKTWLGGADPRREGSVEGD